MSDADPVWNATVSVRAGSPELARALEHALRPEASREVPRARAELRPATGPRLELEIGAADSGAMRAALNTYLGWIHLATTVERALRPAADHGSGQGPRA
jgi:tRNA threonylcarbamoyladenosine modification (KEOPS) complex  Pcc1 subunit